MIDFVLQFPSRLGKKSGRGRKAYLRGPRSLHCVGAGEKSPAYPKTRAFPQPAGLSPSASRSNQPLVPRAQIFIHLRHVHVSPYRFCSDLQPVIAACTMLTRRRNPPLSALRYGRLMTPHQRVGVFYCSCVIQHKGAR